MISLNSPVDDFVSRYSGASFPHSVELFERLARNEVELLYGPSDFSRPTECALMARTYRNRAWSVGEYRGDKGSELHREMVGVATAMEATPDEHCNVWAFRFPGSVTFYVFERVESSTIAFCFKRPHSLPERQRT